MSGDNYGCRFRFSIRKMIYVCLTGMLFLLLIGATAGYYSMSSISKGSSELSGWIELQEQLNKKIVDPLFQLQVAYEHWLQTGAPEDWTGLQQAYKEASQSVSRLDQTSIGHADLIEKIRLEFMSLMATMGQNIDALGKAWQRRAEAVQQIKVASSDIEDVLEQVMETKIDPMREEAFGKKDIQAFSKVSNIDMVANEDVTQPMYKVIAKLNEYLLGKASAQSVEEGWKKVITGFAQWKDMVKSTSLVQEAQIINAKIETMLDLWKKAKTAQEEYKAASSEFQSTMTRINHTLEKIVSEEIEPQRISDLEGVKTMSSRGEKIFVAGTAFGLLVSVLMAIGMFNCAIRPLDGLSEQLKNMAEGATDLTRQLSSNAVNCSQITNCGQTECPCYGKESHCWYEAGSYAEEVVCPTIKSGKLRTCDDCKIYKKAVVSEVDQVATFVNAFVRRMRHLIAKVASQADHVQNESAVMNQISDEMAVASADVQERAHEVKEASEIADQSVSSVAAAMEEMSAAVLEVSQNTNRASEIAQEAKSQTVHTDKVIQELAQSSDKIGQVSNLIGSIAEQTNLLALNATIEAARAGEAGKGFAVVANEVKELAKQTSQSVQEIDEIVKGLQGKAGEATRATARIVEIIADMAEISDSIAAAIEEQTATTNEISENTQRASGVVKDMTRASESIASSGTQAVRGAAQVKEVAQKLNEFSDELNNLIRHFTI